MKATPLFLLLFISSMLYAQIPTNGLVLNLPLDGNVNDTSSYKNNGVNYGTYAVKDRTGKPGKAMAFNGSSSYISIPGTKSLNLTTNKTVSCWIYLPSNVAQNLYSTIIHKDESLTTCTYSLQLLENPSYYSNQYKFDFFFASGSTHYQTYTKQLYTSYKDQWINIAGTYDSISGYSKIYFNGVLSDSLLVGNKISNSSDLTLYLGRGKSDSRTYFNGYMDDILLYNRALTAQEIKQIYTDKNFASAGSDKTVMCGNSVKLDSVITNYNGTGALKYKWSPSVGLSSDTVPNPTASAKSATTYTVTVTFPTGQTASDQVVVNVSSFNVNAGYDSYITCGNSTQLQVTTNYTGGGTLKYKWYPSSGLSNDTIACPVATPSNSTNYTVSVTSPSGCVATDNVNVYIYPIYVDAGSDKTIVCGGTTQLQALVYPSTGKLRYKWTPSLGLDNDTIANPTVLINSNRTYTVTVTTQSGCSASDNVSVFYTKKDKPVIIGVGVNDKNKNVIFWDKSNYTGVESFNIYKETNVANTYSKVGVVPFDSSSFFVDTLSLPNVQSNRYKVALRDKCGFESDLSDYHKTMHLSINKGVGSSWNLIWESYEGFTISTYNIYRGTSSGNMIQIGSISGNNNQFSDFTAPTGDVYYQIEAIRSSNASIIAKDKAKSTTVLTSRSNIATNATGVSGIHDIKDISNSIVLYPNPASNKSILSIGEAIASETNYFICNMLGELVKTGSIVVNNQELDLDRLSAGVYLLAVKSDKFTGTVKIIIQK